MAVRSTRERVVQTLWFEGIGLGVVAPLYGWTAGARVGESFQLVAALSLVVTAWAALFNSVFDAIEWRLTARIASARPARLRMMHAVSFELSAVLVTVPVIYALGDMTWLQALQTDVALTLAYMAYGYAFHCLYDRWRPVLPDARTRGRGQRDALKRDHDRAQTMIPCIVPSFEAPDHAAVAAARLAAPRVGDWPAPHVAATTTESGLADHRPAA